MPAIQNAAIEYACTRLKDHGSRLYQPRSTPASIKKQSWTLQGSQQAVHGRRLTSTSLSPFVLAMLKPGDRALRLSRHPPSRGAHAEDLDPRRDHQSAEDIPSLITKAAQQGAAGWILDPRRTSSGVHVLSMLAGLQPLLGNGKMLTFQMSRARRTAWLENGALVEHFGCGSMQVDERLNEPDAPVALLVDHGTDGAGEGLAIAFTGRRHTCLIGERTAGSNEWGHYQTLSDAAALLVIDSQIKDRQGRGYPKGLTPEVSPFPRPQQSPPLRRILTLQLR